MERWQLNHSRSSMSCRLCEKFLRCVLSPARIQRRTLQIPGKLPSKILPPTHIYSVEDIRPETSALSEGNLHLQKTNDFLENLRCSVSNWAIENSSSSNMWDQSIVWKDTKVDDFEASEMKLPTTENYSLAEKLARIGGKYKRPAFTRERIKKRHKKKKMRKNRFQVGFCTIICTVPNFIQFSLSTGTWDFEYCTESGPV